MNAPRNGTKTLLLACPYLFPVGGGLERYVMDLAAALRQHGEWRVILAASGPANAAPIERDEVGGQVIYRLARQVSWSNTPFSLRWRRDLETIMEREHVTLVNAHAPVVGLADAAARAAGDRPFVLTYHAGPMGKGRLRTDIPIWLYERGLRRLMLRRSDLVICSSAWVRDCLGADVLTKGLTIGPAVDLDRYVPGLTGPGNGILFVGALARNTEYKGLNELLFAVAQLRLRGVPVPTVVVGDGAARAGYERRCRELGIDELVTFAGFLDGDDLVRAYQQAQALVLPTTNDSLPLVLLEAMACGTAVVSTRVGGIPDLLGENERGLLIEPGNRAQLIDAVRDVVTNRALAARLGAAGRAEVQAKYSLARQAELTLDAYDRALRAHRGEGPRRVAIVAPYFPPKIGGLERYALQVAQAVDAAPGLAPLVITSNHARRRTEATWNVGIPTLRLGNLLKISNTPVSPLWAWRIPSAFRRYGVDVINTHSPVPFIADVAAMTAGKRPVVATYHAGSMVKNTGSADGLIRFYERRILPWVLGRARLIVPVTPGSFVARAGRTVVVPPAVDEKVFVPRPAAVRPESPSVLYVGRIDRSSAWKGIGVLLDAVELVLRDEPAVALELVGTGDAVEDFRANANARGIGPSVRFRGALHAAELVAAYQRATVVVLPSLTEAESFGMSLIEGMSCGRPVIGSRVGGIVNVISDRQDGLLVAPGDRRALADALLAVIRDPGWANQLGASGRRKVEARFRAARTAAVYVEMFEELLPGRQRLPKP